MKKSRRITAEELINELSGDPTYQAIQKAKAERMRRKQVEFQQLANPILNRLQMAGYPAESFDAILTRYAPLPSEVTSILLDELCTARNEELQEGLVRVLCAAAEPFNGMPLAQCFDSAQSEGLRFAILNTIALSHPHSIVEWIEHLQSNEYYARKLQNLSRP